MFSMHEEVLYAPRTLRGASGYIAKQEAPEKILIAIRKFLAGEVYLGEKMKAQLLSGIAGKRSAGLESPLETLSDRELGILTLLGRGSSTREIAEQLGISCKTVETHRAHI